MMAVGTSRVSAAQRTQIQAMAWATALAQHLTQQAAANAAAAAAAAAANPGQPPGFPLPPPPPLVLLNPWKDDLKVLLLSFGMNADTADEIRKQMFESTNDFILFEYENFYGFWKAMDKFLAMYANRQIWASPREREQIISLHAWVKNRVMLGISAEANEYTPDEAAAPLRAHACTPAHTPISISTCANAPHVTCACTRTYINLELITRFLFVSFCTLGFDWAY